MSKLDNTRQEMFCQELARGASQKAAYAKAGFAASNTGRAAKLAKDPRIIRRVAEIIDDFTKRLPVYKSLPSEMDRITANRVARRMEQSKELVAKELALIGFANLQDFLRFEEQPEEGKIDWSIDISQATREQLAAVRSITVDTLPNGGVVRTRLQFHDKIGALTHLTRMFGWIMDKPESVTPLEQRLAQMTPEQREADARELAARIRARLDMDTQERAAATGGIGSANTTDIEEESTDG